MHSYDEFKNWYTHTAPDESEVAMVDMAALAWEAALSQQEEEAALAPSPTHTGW